MGKAHRPGGLYRSASGSFHDGRGHEIPLADVPRELLTADEIGQLEDNAADTPDEPTVSQARSPSPSRRVRTPTRGTGDDDTDAGKDDGAGTLPPPPPPPPAELSKDFPGYLALMAAGVKTEAEVFAHPNLSQIKGLGPKTMEAIEALRPKAPEA